MRSYADGCMDALRPIAFAMGVAASDADLERLGIDAVAAECHHRALFVGKELWNAWAALGVGKTVLDEIAAEEKKNAG